jgi:hypothetical protein
MSIDLEKTYGLLPDLIPQKVNLNGTDRVQLVALYLDCISAVRKLETAMGAANPHGRDYQTHSNPDASIEARKAWGLRRIWLDAFKKDLEHSAEMVSAQR